MSDSMKVKVIAFASLKEALGPESEIGLASGSKLSSLIASLKESNPGSDGLIDLCRAALNDRIIEDDPVLEDGMTVYLLPPSSGG